MNQRLTKWDEELGSYLLADPDNTSYRDVINRLGTIETMFYDKNIFTLSQKSYDRAMNDPIFKSVLLLAENKDHVRIVPESYLPNPEMVYMIPVTAIDNKFLSFRCYDDVYGKNLKGES